LSGNRCHLLKDKFCDRPTVAALIWKCLNKFYLGPNVVAEWLALLFRIREVLGSNLDPGPAILTEVFRGLCQFLQANDGIVGISPRPLSSTSFTIHYSLIILSFDSLSY
jgi:hypothetical protein